jgi:hypothetical protein
MKQEFQDKVRIQINRFIFSMDLLQQTSQLTRIVDSNETEVKNALKQLAENHAIVLHP